MSPPLLMDTTEKCLVHFADSFATNRTRPLLAEFCGVHNRTASDWLRGKNLPVGEALIKLRIFLNLAGYRIAELDNLSQSFRQLAQVIAVDERYGPEEVKQRLGYRNSQEIYRLALHGNTGALTENRPEKLKLLLEETADDVKMKLAMWGARIDEVLKDAAATAPRPSPPRRGSAPVERHSVQLPTVMVATSSLPVVLDHLVSAMTSLLDGLYDQMDTEEFEVFDVRRQQVFDQIGRDRLRKLIDQLETLS